MRERERRGGENSCLLQRTLDGIVTRVEIHRPTCFSFFFFAYVKRFVTRGGKGVVRRASLHRVLRREECLQTRKKVRPCLTGVTDNQNESENGTGSKSDGDAAKVNEQLFIIDAAREGEGDARAGTGEEKWFRCDCSIFFFLFSLGSMIHIL